MEATNYRYTEDPGTENSLGVVRININNPYGVYMHDTSEKGVFGDDNRFVSSGCIRVQNVRDYVQWLLKDTAWLGSRRISTRRSAPAPAPTSRSPRRSRSTGSMSPPGAAPNGLVQFREDIYQRDGFSPVVTGSIGRPEPQDNVQARAVSIRGDRDGNLEPMQDDQQ